MRLFLLSLMFAVPAFAADAPAPQSAGDALLHGFLQYVLPPLIGVLMLLVGLALKKLSEFLHVKAEGSATGMALVKGADYLSAAVSHLMAGLGPEVQKALANDGKIDAAERAALKAKALELLKAELPAGLQATLGAAFEGGLGTWLSGKAEQAINAAEAQARLSGLPVPPAP